MLGLVVVCASRAEYCVVVGLTTWKLRAQGTCLFAGAGRHLATLTSVSRTVVRADGAGTPLVAAIRALWSSPPPANLGLRGLQAARTTNVRRGLVQRWPKVISRHPVACLTHPEARHSSAVCKHDFTARVLQHPQASQLPIAAAVQSSWPLSGQALITARVQVLRASRWDGIRMAHLNQNTGITVPWASLGSAASVHLPWACTV